LKGFDFRGYQVIREPGWRVTGDQDISGKGEIILSFLLGYPGILMAIT